MILPCGIALQASNSILVESVFHECDTNAPAVRIFHGAKDAKFGEIGKYSSLRSWRLGVKNFVEVVLFKNLIGKNLTTNLEDVNG